MIHKRSCPSWKDPEAILKSALANPVCCKSLMEEARNCRSACILICDNHPPVPNGIVLPVLVKELIRAGIKPEAITILVATGLHRRMKAKNSVELVGSDWVLTPCRWSIILLAMKRIMNPWDPARQYPVKLDRRFVFADLRIVVGLVERISWPATRAEESWSHPVWL